MQVNNTERNCPGVKTCKRSSPDNDHIHNIYSIEEK